MSAYISGLAAVLVLTLGLLTAACASAPPYQGWEDERLLDHAQAEFDDGDYEEAIRALNRLLLSSGTGLAPDGRFLLARAYYAEEDYLTAVSEFNRFLNTYGGHPLAPRASLGVCQAYEALSPHPQRDQSYTEQAITACSNVALDYRGLDVAEEAQGIVDEMRDKLAQKQYVIAEHYLEREFWDSAIIYYERVVTRYPETDWAPRSLRRLVEVYQEIGYEDLVEEYRQQLLDQYPNSPEAQALVNGA